MIELHALWLPILLSAVIVFASALQSPLFVKRSSVTFPTP